MRSSSSHGVTLVVAALGEEIAPLRRLLSRRRSGGDDGVRLVEGLLAGESVVAAVTGDGAACARRGVEAALERTAPRRLVVIGAAGGLTEELGPASLVVAREVREEGGESFTADPALVARATSVAGRAGVVVSAATLVSSPAAKADLHRRLGLRETTVVDLESASYIRAAVAAGVPWLVLRAVSDTAGEALPPFLEGCLRPDGGVSRTAVVRYALTHPGTWADLARLRRRVRLCAGALAAGVEALLGHQTFRQTPDPESIGE